MKFTTTRWVRVNRKQPCPVCRRPKYCGMTSDGRAVRCMWVENGWELASGGWLHRLSEPARLTADAARSRASATDIASIGKRNLVYHALAAEFGLSDAHRAHLTGPLRGLAPERLEMFASVPALDYAERCELAARVERSAGVSVDGVPGFCRGRRRPMLVPAATGFLVPAPDKLGRVQAFTIRADAPEPYEPRYKWLSSADWDGGASSGAPAAVWRPELASACAWITEGSLKALIAATRLDACVIGVGGVGLWRSALPLLEGAPAGYPVVVAFDQDTDERTREIVRRQRDAFAWALRRAGFDVRVATWHPDAKGVDDALLRGIPVDTETWSPTVTPARRPAGARPLRAVARPLGVALARPGVSA